MTNMDNAPHERNDFSSNDTYPARQERSITRRNLDAMRDERDEARDELAIARAWLLSCMRVLDFALWHHKVDGDQVGKRIRELKAEMGLWWRRNEKRSEMSQLRRA